MARVAAVRAGEFERERNAEIKASVAAVAQAQAEEEFARARNAEIALSMAVVAAQRAPQRAPLMTGTIDAIAECRTCEDIRSFRSAN